MLVTLSCTGETGDTLFKWNMQSSPFSKRVNQLNSKRRSNHLTLRGSDMGVQLRCNPWIRSPPILGIFAFNQALRDIFICGLIQVVLLEKPRCQVQLLLACWRGPVLFAAGIIHVWAWLLGRKHRANVGHGHLKRKDGKWYFKILEGVCILLHLKDKARKMQNKSMIHFRIPFFFGGGAGMGGFFFRSPPMKSEVPEVSFTNACLSHSSQE